MMALQLSRESYIVFPSSTIIEERFVHPMKILPDMDVTLLGMVMDANSEQF